MNYKEQIEKMARLSSEEQIEYIKLNDKIRKKTRVENKENGKKAYKNMALSTAGLVGATQGIKGIHHVDDNGLLDGRRKLYHNTDKVNVKSILEDGLKASKTNGDSFTRKVMQSNGVDFAPFENKTYLGKNKAISLGSSNARYINQFHEQHPFYAQPSPIDILKNRYKNTKTLKASVPLKEYNNLKSVPNPELRGAKSINEFLEKMKNVPVSDTVKKQLYKGVGENTITIDGDFSSKFIKGGKGYQKLTTKEVLKHIKNNPGMAAKGVALAGLGTAGAVGGTYLAGKAILDNTKANHKLRKERSNDEDRKRLNNLARKSLGWSIKK